MKNFLALALVILSLSSSAADKIINEGPWRFEMRATYAVIPFVIDFKFKGGNLTGTLRNGKEDIPLNDIQIKGDTIKIPLQHYENGLELRVLNKETVRGDFVRYNKNPELRSTVDGKHGSASRYSGKWNRPSQNLSGEWAVDMKEDEGKEYKGIVLFEQKGNELHGTIMSPTGDYRYFEGYVSGDNFEAASFDGVYNYVIKGKVNKKKLEGSIMANWMTKIEGRKDSRATLPNPYQQTQLEKLSFSYPDIDGRKVSLSDERFKGKPVIVTFFGSWCPNCIDEVKYLNPWYKENKSRGIEIVALGFERSLSEAQARMQLTKAVKKLGIPFPVLLVGATAEDKPMDKIPGLKNFISFPTTVFLNKKHEVVKVHAGFTGPSTGKHFEHWKKEFNRDVDKLLE